MQLVTHPHNQLPSATEVTGSRGVRVRTNTQGRESGIFFKWLSFWCWYVTKSGPNWEGYRILHESCKSAMMQLQIKGTVSKCRGRWASERCELRCCRAQALPWPREEGNSWAQHMNRARKLYCLVLQDPSRSCTALPYCYWDHWKEWLASSPSSCVLSQS